MRRVCGGLVIAIVLCWRVVPVWADAMSVQDRNEIEQLRTLRGFSSEEVGQLVEQVNRAGDKGIPTEPLANKVKEGLAKGIDPKRIDPVLRQLVVHYESAHEVLREAGMRGVAEGNRQRAMETMAEAFARGATREEVRELTRVTQDGKSRVTQETLAAGAKGLAVMKEGKIASKEGAALVAEGLRQGYRATDLLDISREVKRRGSELQEGRLRTLREQVSRGERSDRLFRDDHSGSSGGDRGDHGRSGDRLREDRGGSGSDRSSGSDRGNRPDRSGGGHRDR